MPKRLTSSCNKQNTENTKALGIRRSFVASLSILGFAIFANMYNISYREMFRFSPNKKQQKNKKLSKTKTNIPIKNKNVLLMLPVLICLLLFIFRFLLCNDELLLNYFFKRV